MDDAVMQAPRQRNRTIRIAIALVAFDLIALAAAIWSIFVRASVDFPCESSLAHAAGPTATTQILYCISLWPRTSSGGVVYASAAVDQSQVQIEGPISWYGSITLQREGDTLIANGEALGPGEKYSKFAWTQSLNPWLLFTARLTLGNGGTTKNALKAIGDIKEGFLPSPIGPAILALGCWLLIRSRRYQTQTAA